MGRYLEEYGKTLDDFGLPQPSTHSNEVIHEYARWNAQAPNLLATASTSFATLNNEQQQIIHKIVHATAHDCPLRLFIDGKAGRGKTFLVNAVCNWARAQGYIVLPTATSAFAAQLFPGGRTTHSTFKVRSTDYMFLTINNDNIQIGSCQ